MGTIRVFNIKGVNPATMQVMELLLIAETEVDAKRQAQAAGLALVAVGESFAVEDRRPHLPQDRRGAPD